MSSSSISSSTSTPTSRPTSSTTRLSSNTSTLPTSTTPSTNGSTSDGSASPSTITSLTSSPSSTPTPIQSTSAIEPDPDPEPEPDPSEEVNPDGAPIYDPPVIHKLVIDTGTCSDVGKPKVVPAANTRPRELESLGNGRYTTTLNINNWYEREVNIWLEDHAPRCGSQGVCTLVYALFDADRLKLSVSRSGDRDYTMYPLSFWSDGGELYDGTRADSEANKYNCWGWSESECPFANKFFTDPEYTLSTTTSNATTYITFCPPDGPAYSDVPSNPHPAGRPPGTEVTEIVASAPSTMPVSTIYQTVATTRTRGQGVMIPGAETTSVGAAPTPSTTPAPNAENDPPRACPPGPDASTCVVFNTLAPLEEQSTVPVGKPFFASIIMTTVSGVAEPVTTVPVETSEMQIFPTFWNLDSTTVVPVATGTPTPTRPRTENEPSPTLLGFPTTLTDSLGSPIATSTVGAQVIPTFSAITDTRGSVISKIPLNLTTTIPPPTPTPPPESFILTSWTTWTTVNGSTIPILGGQVGVLTTVPVTYVLQPDTTIPLVVYSSISAQSTRTSIPSATAQAVTEQTAQGNRASKIAGAIVGTLVGLTLLGVLFWVLCTKRNRRRQRTPDYAAQRSPVWGPSGGFGSAESSRQGSQLDLDSEPEPRASFVEPWVEQGRPRGQNRKMQREMEEYGGGVLAAAAGPSRRDTTGASSSVGRSYDALRPGKSANRVPAELRPEPLNHWPMRNNTLSSIHSQGSSSGHNHTPAVLQSPSAPARTPPARSLSAPVSPAPASTQPLPPVPVRPTYSQEPIEEEPRHNAIPPLYNEAWNIRPARSSE
ncbi:hypothetical protein FRC09_004121 [Ceratobasidium sp. 395]|nr:hypothetical protein FRC09_004121 [Ceratobasidium sp. 395]